MGISLSGVEAWSPDDQIEPGTYIFQAAKVARDTSSNGNPQVQVDWRVKSGQYAGAEQRDWITLTDRALGRVAQVLEAAGREVSGEFDSFELLADAVAKALEGATVEGIVRLKPSRKDPSREFPEIVGYRKPTASDIAGEPLGVSVPSVGTNDDGKPLPF